MLISLIIFKNGRARSFQRGDLNVKDIFIAIDAKFDMIFRWVTLLA